MVTKRNFKIKDLQKEPEFVEEVNKFIRASKRIYKIQ